jgi:hypothetical protein
MKCNATTKAGKRCKAHAYAKGKCIFHYKVGGRPGQFGRSYAQMAKQARMYRKK